MAGRQGKVGAAVAVCVALVAALVVLFVVRDDDSDDRSVAGFEMIADPRQEDSQEPALDLREAGFVLDDGSATFRLQLEELDRAATQVIADLDLGDRSVRVTSRFDDEGDQLTIGVATNVVSESTMRFYRGFEADWDFDADVVTITMSRYLRDPRGPYEQGIFSATSTPRGSLFNLVEGDRIEAEIERS